MEISAGSKEQDPAYADQCTTNPRSPPILVSWPHRALTSSGLARTRSISYTESQAGLKTRLYT